VETLQDGIHPRGLLGVEGAGCVEAVGGVAEEGGGGMRRDHGKAY
jgi:hypothetical protein